MSNQKPHSEEIDLITLFEFFGKALNKIANCIKYIFQVIFEGIILFLKFFQIHFKKIVIAGFIGLIGGFIWDYYGEERYRSSMVVEPNFNSVQQLYNNISFYNKLAKEKEYKSLAEALKLTSEEAKTIKKITIESSSSTTEKLQKYSNLIKDLDSTSRQSITFEDYSNNFNDINAKFHKVEIESTNPHIAKKCSPIILKSVENNPYFDTQKKLNNENINFQKKNTEKQLREIDSLQLFYKKLKIIEAKKVARETNINLSENSVQPNTEIELLKQSRELENIKLSLNTKRANTKNTINIISDFPNNGNKITDWYYKKKIILPLIAIFSMLMFILLMSLNTFLKSYTKHKEER